MFFIGLVSFIVAKKAKSLNSSDILLYNLIYFDNMAKRILLSVPEQILKKLESEKEKYAYSSIQEVILEMLRDKLFIEAKPEKETRGRPKKIREEKILTRKKIFSKKGEPISI